MEAATVPEGMRDLGRLWWLAALWGALTLGVGILALVYPDETLSVIAIIFGVYLLVAGGFDIAGAVTARDATGGRRIALGLLGALALIAGLLVLRKPGESLLALALVVGIYLVVAGVMRFVAAAEMREGRGLNLLFGLVDVVAGAIIVSSPHIGVVTLAVVFGIALILRGLLLVMLGFSLRSIR